MTTLYRIDKNTFLEYDPVDVCMVVFKDGEYVEYLQNAVSIPYALQYPCDMDNTAIIEKLWYTRIDTEEWWKEFFTLETAQREVTEE